MTLENLHRAVLYLPALTTVCAIVFCWQLFSRYRSKGGGLHLLWWGIGMATYGLGTLTEAYTSIVGWNPTVFRTWYIAGAFLGGYPLAQGTIYLLMKKRFADRSAWIVCSGIAVASVFVWLTPLDLGLVEAHRLSGRVIEWRWVRLVSPFINLYSLAFLAGGAVVSAMRFRRAESLRNRYLGNIWIAIGAILPGIGGSMTRAGYVEALYITELVGLLCIYAGYRMNISGKTAQAVPDRDTPNTTRKLAMKRASMILLLTLFALSPTISFADAAENREAENDAEPVLESVFATTTVTATGSETDTFETTIPVTVISSQEDRERVPEHAADLLRAEPGVDVNGVGPNQSRPVIRGQRGLRVLFLENGLRMNNARRQTDFGEIPGLVDVESVDAVEIVRGPASVLYGSDAIGGVLNLVSRTPRGGSGWKGALGARYGDAGETTRANANAEYRGGQISFEIGASSRSGENYDSASGSFGNISLAEEASVIDTELDSTSINGAISRSLSDSQELSFRFNRYRAEDTGFGFVEPTLIGESEDFRIRIFYPFQDFDRYSLAYNGTGLETGFADTVRVQGYYQNNERELVNDIDINIGPIFPGAPDSSVDADTLNFTDLETLGLRAEANKGLADRHLLTYGVEFYEDDSFNTDFSQTTTTLRFPFPPFELPSISTDSVANAPNASNTSYGAFAQAEFEVGDRWKLSAGARYQSVETRAEATPGWNIDGLDFDEDATVGAVSALYRATDYLHITGSYGTAFRAPNIVERLFNGLTPEGIGFQILNPNLMSEESENVDIGFKYRRQNVLFEVTAFQNDIDDGVIQYFLSPGEVATLPAATQAEIAATGVNFVVQQRNIDRLRYEGVEVALGYQWNDFAFHANYTHLDGKRVDSTNPPSGDTFSDKYNLSVRYQPKAGRYWAEYRLRHNGDEPANVDPNEPLPAIGAILPSFTLHSLSVGANLFEGDRFKHDLWVVGRNLSDELYAEFSNATFFRPEPGRNFVASYRLTF